MKYKIDISIKEAIDNWIKLGLNPGSCTTLLLKGDYLEAYNHAHPLIKPHWDEHVAYVESLPLECRGENMKAWKKSFKER